MLTTFIFFLQAINHDELLLSVAVNALNGETSLLSSYLATEVTIVGICYFEYFVAELMAFSGAVVC